MTFSLEHEIQSHHCPASPHSGLPLSLLWINPHLDLLWPPPRNLSVHPSTLCSNFLYHLEHLWLFTSCFFCFEGSPIRSTLPASKFQCLLQTQMGIFVSDSVVCFPLSHLDSCTHCCYHTTCHDVVTIRHVCCLTRPGLPQGERRLSCSPWHPVQSLALNRCPGNVVESINYDVISVDKELELISWMISKKQIKDDCLMPLERDQQSFGRKRERERGRGWGVGNFWESVTKLP